MKYFADDYTKPIVRQRGIRKVLEIGASFGANTELLLSLDGVDLTIIDPCIDLDLVQEFGSRVSVRKGLSLDVLPTLTEPFDCIFVDGDHNWYTVINELRLIERHGLISENGIIFLHDVTWPYGRRDMYYQHESVPKEFHQPFAKNGMQRGQSTLVQSGGFNEEYLNAIEEGGPRNGVLTAVEDFIRESQHDYCLIVDDRQWGLGILFRRTASGADELRRNLRRGIFMRRYIEPKVQVWNSLIQKSKTSGVAKLLRRCGNALFRKS